MSNVMTNIKTEMMVNPKPASFPFPVVAGKWEISGSFCIEVKEKPSKWNQWWIRFLLGWIWIDREEV